MTIFINKNLALRVNSKKKITRPKARFNFDKCQKAIKAFGQLDYKSQRIFNSQALLKSSALLLSQYLAPKGKSLLGQCPGRPSQTRAIKAGPAAKNN
jgi:hypothetical protein